MVARRKLKDWLRPGGEMQPWVSALRAIDARGDKAELVKLLKSEAPIPSEARWHLADLLDRYQLKLHRGGHAGGRTPSYDRSAAETPLIWAAEAVRKQRKAGRTRDEGIELAVEVYGVSEETLRNYLQGKHASARRMKKRRPPSAQRQRP